MSDYKVIGTRPPRVDGPAKVAGRALYGPDILRPRMAYGVILRSPHAHARIRGIDTGKAEAIPGVYAVATAADLGGEGKNSDRDNTFAGAKALYHGHPVAAVAARTPQLAASAAAAVLIDYEELPAVVDVRKAMEPDAPIIDESLRTDTLAAPKDAPTNIAGHIQQVKGDPDKGFKQADVIIERVFESATVHQGYIEPHAATAEWTSDDTLTIYTTTQGSFDARRHVAGLLGLRESAVRIVPTEVGGAFGGKNASFVDVAAAVLARKCGRPVQITMTQEEVLLATTPSSGTWIRVKVGASNAGLITSAEAELCYEAGAYPGSPVGAGATVMLSPYNIPNGRVDGYDVLVNKTHIGPYRAPGGTPANFAMETVIDELAEKLEIDPIEFRKKNCAVDGTESVMGAVLAHSAGVEVLDAAAGASHYTDDLPQPDGPVKRGRGVAFAYWGNWGARSSVTIHLNGDGTFSLTTGSVDITGTRTTIAMQAAEELEVSLSDIDPAFTDTDNAGVSETSAGSRTTVATGTAAVEAARNLIDQMKERAASLWETDKEKVDYSRGVLSSGRESMTIAELAADLADTGGAIRGKGDVNVRRWGGTFTAHIADVEVDTETGKVRVLRYTAIQDVGRAVHPGQVEGQIRGGTTQGIGWALYEGFSFDDSGRMQNANYLDYKMPTITDVPSIEAVILEHPWPDHPFGIRGVGEAPIVPPPAAIANAIYRAVGHRPTRLPMTPDRFLESCGVI